jgi:HlyD family secretion protein
MNKKRSVIAVAVVALVALIGMLVYRRAYAKQAPQYRFVQVERGDMQSTVSATGTLGAVTTVSVGTQVSGQVAELLVDYNSHVKKGQLLARIDPTLAQQSVTDAEANLAKIQAQAMQASRDEARNKQLANDGLIAKSALELTQSAYVVAGADVRQAQVALDRAKQNLAYTNIYAPIDGVVVDRNVNKGQTVAASLSAPQLFLIANDLSQMQILAQVGESDIAQIKEGEPAQFTVQALQGQTFKGTVQQVRLQSSTTDNVVNYTVVVSVGNPQNKLLPGMTARVNFLTKSANGVLKVSNAALRFRPATTTTTAATSTATTATSAPKSGASRGQRSQQGGTLYTLDAKGQLQPIGVSTGVTDGTMTEVQGKAVVEGMKVVAGIAQPTTQTAQTQTSASTPFQSGSQQQQQQQNSRGPRGGF